jgi:anti-anti-sigma regulatory factor
MVTSFAIVINLPESLGPKEAKKMVRELKTQIKKEPPRVILDLSRVKTMDCAGLHGLLTCMQEIARYDCAIQLRAISPEAATLLELARTIYSKNSHRCRRKLRVLPLSQPPLLRK